MAKEGFHNEFEINIDDMMDKEFHTFRRSKPVKEWHWKWNPFNWVNKHYMRRADHIHKNM